MKVSKNTIEKMQAMSVLSEETLFVPGDKQLAITQSESVLAEFTFNDAFPKHPEHVAFNKLSAFVALLKKFDNPEIVFEEDRAIISDKNTRMVYKLFAPSIILNSDAVITPYSAGYEKGIQSKDTYYDFVLKREDLVKFLGFARMNDLPETMIKCEDGRITLRAFNQKDKEDDSNVVEVVVAETESDDISQPAVIETSLFDTIFATDYNVVVDGDEENGPRFVQFTNPDAGLKYTVTLV